MYTVAASAMMETLVLKDLDEVFRFLFLFLPLLHLSIFSSFGGEKERKMSFSRARGPQATRDLLGDKEMPCSWTGKRKYESFTFF
jgi:hypothetical protein